MRWYNHILIGAATTAVIAPQLVPLAALGATAPDWLEWLLAGLGRPVKHRTSTHWVAGWLVLLVGALAVWDVGGGWLAAFAWGGVTHVFADSLTVSGVPFSPLSDRRFHLLGGQLRTGGLGEYVVAGGCVLVCWLVFGAFNSQAAYLPFFPDWADRYARGVVTAKEWKENRFRFF